MKPIPKEIKASAGTVRSCGAMAVRASIPARPAAGLPVRGLRDEWTHQVTVQPDQVPAVVKPEKIEVVGNYALHFTWSDGHSTASIPLITCANYHN